MTTHHATLFTTVGGLALVLFLVAGCTIDGPRQPAIEPVEPPESADVATSAVERESSPVVTDEDSETLRSGNTEFALDLYRRLRAEGVEDGEENLFFSPHSISIALAMTYAGAEGETERQMAETMHYELPEPTLHETFNSLDMTLATRSARLDVLNATWGQVGWDFQPAYLDTLALNYGAAMYLLDFGADPEAARIVINDWVSDHTEDRIEELLSEGMLTPLTRLVLTNAIYFNASWQIEFDETETLPTDFTCADGSTVTADMMHLEADLRSAHGPGWSAVELPYEDGELAMVLVLPTEDQPDLDTALDGRALDDIVDGLSETEGLIVNLPRFTFGAEIDLDEQLPAMGMVDAFNADVADFSGMDGRRDLVISEVVHQAWIEVTERGTEAAAATAVVMEWNSAPPEVVFDRPFFFFIRDNETGAILFLGRIVDPTDE